MSSQTMFESLKAALMQSSPTASLQSGGERKKRRGNRKGNRKGKKCDKGGKCKIGGECGGEEMAGGKRTGLKKKVKRVKYSKFKKLLKKKNMKFRMKGGEMTVTDETGAIYKCAKSETGGTPSDLTKDLIDQLKTEESSPPAMQEGGKKRKVMRKKPKSISPTTRMSKTDYKKFLNKKDGEQLKKLAKLYNIKITTKVNGKTKNIKVENLRKKLLNKTIFL